MPPVKPLEFVTTATGCRECVSHRRDRHGYTWGWWGGRSVLLHRLEWEKVHGRISAGLVVRHRCDNRACCNPEHLELGTQEQNIADRDARGRSLVGGYHHNAGERNGRAKLRVGDVEAIRASGSPTRQLARLYGVTPKAIRAIRTGARWKQLVSAERLAAATAA